MFSLALQNTICTSAILHSKMNAFSSHYTIDHRTQDANSLLKNSPGERTGPQATGMFLVCGVHGLFV